MTADILGDAPQRWLKERSTYQVLCKKVVTVVDDATKYISPPPRVTWRTKEPASLFAKIGRKEYPGGYDDVQDKAGVRIVCTYLETIPRIEAIIGNRFNILCRDDKTANSRLDEIGYHGIHYDVSMCPSDTVGDEQLDGLVCEIQVLTRAQSLWADISHELAYKSPLAVSENVRRTILLQSALLEIFDRQMDNVRQEANNNPERRIVDMMEALEIHFGKICGQPYDKDLTRYVVQGLQHLVCEWEEEGCTVALAKFVSEHEGRLRQIYQDYAGVDRHVMLHQPEAIMTFMWLDRDIYTFTDAWTRILPYDDLRGLCDVWGVADAYSYLFV